MKNKKWTYILLPVALILWGLIFYKIFSNLRKLPQVNPQIQKDEIKNQGAVNPDTLVIVANYRDPFLSRPVRSVSASVAPEKKKVNSNTRSISARRIKQLKWPTIEYGGVVDNQQVKKVALLRINDRKFLMQKGDENSEVKVLEIFSDSIVLSFKEEIKTIHK